MKSLAFALRNTKEILRDPVNLMFGLGFPLVILLLLSAIQANIPVDLFKMEKLSPGIAVFGLSFLSLFAAVLIAKDRSTSFLMRLFASPLKPSEFIAGYALPLLPMAVAQSVICFATALLLGLSLNINLVWALITLLPAAILFIGIGLLAGSIFTDKQVGAICGALLTNLTAWFSGTWFDLSLVGGWFKALADALPFVHAVEATRSAVLGDFGSILPHLIWVSVYAIVIFVFAVLAFYRRMKS